jgi:2-polyprenyl-6-methoxyphenol hydroxylase-like FAD-dependent oxidoreductase
MDATVVKALPRGGKNLLAAGVTLLFSNLGQIFSLPNLLAGTIIIKKECSFSKGDFMKTSTATSINSRTGVLVVGAGPVGLTMAAELARYGVSVRIVEKAAERTDKSKALVVWSRTLELMDRMGCTGAFIKAGMKATAANIAAGDEPIARITLDKVESPYPYALMLAQSETERLMEEHLTSLGVQVERSVELVGFEAAEEGVVSTLRFADGHEQSQESAWLIGCDGAHSIVRHQLGMRFEGNTLASDWILADLHLEGVPNPGEIAILWHADGVLAIFPITRDRYRIIANVESKGAKTEGVGLNEEPTLEQVQAVLDQRGPGGISASKPVWLAGFHINERKVKEYRAGRVFLAGDAAHIHSPAGGQGMNTGMQDACNLAWKLALVSRGICAAEPLLSSYSTERGAVGDQVLKAAGVTTQIGILRGGVRQAIRNHLASLVFGFSAVRAKAADALTEISIGYPESPLNATGAYSHGGPKTGERAPIRMGEKPVGSGDTPRFALFADSCAAASHLVARYSQLLEPQVRTPFHSGGLWLVRPDGYVAVASGKDDWEPLADLLDRIAVR